MRHIDYYVKQQESVIPEMIKQRLESGPVIIEGRTISSKDDLQLKSVLAAIRIAARRKGRQLFNAAKKSSYRFVEPKPGQTLNGIVVEYGIILPIKAPEIIEDHEITTLMIADGLYKALTVEFDEYYYKLLSGINMSNVTADVRKNLDRWESEKNQIVKK